MGKALVALKNDRQAYGTASRAELAFLDAAGRVLADGSAGEPSGLVSVRPFASAQASRAWRECFDTQSRWLMTWVRQARYAAVDLGKCKNCRIAQPQ